MILVRGPSKKKKKRVRSNEIDWEPLPRKKTQSRMYQICVLLRAHGARLFLSRPLCKVTGVSFQTCVI